MSTPFIGGVIPLHIGVVLFVLISGYFQIKPTFKGVFVLVFTTFIYYVPLSLIVDNIYGFRASATLNDLMFISHTPYWYIRTYIYLYVLSPAINKYINSISLHRQLFFLTAIGIIATWFGLTNGDSNLIDGKNLTNFVFIYLLGNTLRKTEHKWKLIKAKYLLFSYLALNCLLVLSWIACRDSALGSIIMRLSFPYNGIILHANAVLLFMIFAKCHFASFYINKIAASVLAVYLIHSHPFILEDVIGYPVKIILNSTDCVPIVFISFIILTSAIFMVCVIIDKTLTPIKKCAIRGFEYIYSSVYARMKEHGLTKMSDAKDDPY